ncbi:Spx/MgsR family RNA polymerase-binding regulatory protein [Aerococcaceae bacterium zg-ZJ1578]|uniref:Spx/MgsR family RNA polymerase-binding regulatory protein n=1 Tax=Aerococcaceae bacterium zg-252 TaxID=2796928 RepID=UPI001A220359|nr:Spx/MgsR family RNA polymerase-binding regulatory protein [Aerococcaceae bacterium zg-1578]
MLHLIGLTTCSTCKAIEKQLKAKEIDYLYQDVRQERPTESQVQKWVEQIGEVSIKKLVNTSGMRYRELQLKDKWDSLMIEDKISLLASDGMLIKRPILETSDGNFYIGKEVSQFLEQL